MTRAKLNAQIVRLIAEHQATQRAFPPSSPQWKFASGEINRLAKLIQK